MKTSRRNFLRIAGLTIAALGVGKELSGEAHAAPAVQGSYKTNAKELQAKRWGMVIDTRKFKSQEDFNKLINACHSVHNVPDIPTNQNVKWMWTDTFAHVFAGTPDEFQPEHIQTGQFLLLCNHCQNPPCVRVCPTQATFKSPDGIVGMDPHRCIGCRFCMAGCPFGARSFNFMDPRPYIAVENTTYPTRMRGVVEKCTFCVERLAVGKLPACVEASDGALCFGDLEDPKSTVRQALAENFAIRRNPQLGTGPSVFYII